MLVFPGSTGVYRYLAGIVGTLYQAQFFHCGVVTDVAQAHFVPADCVVDFDYFVHLNRYVFVSKFASGLVCGCSEWVFLNGMGL